MKSHRRSRFRIVFSLAVIAIVAVCASARAGQVSARARHEGGTTAIRTARDNTGALHRRIARLRRSAPLGSARHDEPFARTAEEARQKVTEQVIAEELQRAADEMEWDPITESGCSFLLSETEQAQIKQASREFMTFSRTLAPDAPPIELHALGAYPQASKDLQGAHQAAQEILGRERYVEVFRSCNAERLESDRKDRTAGVKVMATMLDLPPHLTDAIQKLAEEKDIALGEHGLHKASYLDDKGSLVGLGDLPQEEMAEWARTYDKLSDRYDRRFRDLLGPELWAKYKQSFTDESWETPWQKIRLREMGGALFQKPLDEAEIPTGTHSALPPQ